MAEGNKFNLWGEIGNNIVSKSPMSGGVSNNGFWNTAGDLVGLDTWGINPSKNLGFGSSILGSDAQGRSNIGRIAEQLFVQPGGTAVPEDANIRGNQWYRGDTPAQDVDYGVDTSGKSLFGGGGYTGPSLDSMFGDASRLGLFQSTSDFDTGDYDSEMNKAIGSFSNLQNVLQGLHPAALAELDRTYASGRAGIEEGRQRRSGEIQRAGTTAGERTEQAINEARRTGAEMQQGIQSRFGSQTSAGGFVGELTGRETQRQIGAQRQQFEQTMRDLTAASQDLEREVSTKIFQLDTNLVNAKSSLERDLRTRLAEIETDKGMLRADKAKTKLGALQDYKRLVAEIEGNNAQVKQSLYSTYLNQQEKVRSAVDDLEYTSKFVPSGEDSGRISQVWEAAKNAWIEGGA